MSDSLLPLKLPPGLLRNGTEYQSAGRWRLANFVRFFRGAIRPIGGWIDSGINMAPSAVLPGVARAMHAWSWDATTGVVSFAVGTTGVANTAKLQVNLVLPSGHNSVDITPAGNPAVNRTWELDNFGKYLIALAVDAAGTSTSYFWDANIANRATAALAGSPTNPISVVVTPERFVTLLGGSDGASDVWRTVYWADQESYTDWTPTAVNAAGSFTLNTTGTLVAGRRGKTETLIWTTDDLWRMSYIGGVFVHSFAQIGQQCGLVGSKAVAMVDSRAFWMGPNGFFAYDGFVQPIACEVHEAVFGNIEPTYMKLVHAVHNANFNEVTWFYPSYGATECDLYVTWNYVENHWVTGTLSRTASVAAPASWAVAGQIMMTGKTTLSGYSGSTVYIHESGTAYLNANGTSEGAAYVDSGPIEPLKGERVMTIDRLVPDENTLGDVLATIYGRMYPTMPEITYGPFPLDTPTSVRIKAKQIRVRLTGFNTTTAALVKSPVSYMFRYRPYDTPALASFTRATVSTFTGDTLGVDGGHQTPAHSGSWRVGILRLGVKPGSRR